jgi:hypothetical protein
MAAIIISPRMERLRPGSWLPLPALRSAQLSTSPAAKNSKPAAAQKTKQQQALTQAPSTKQSKFKPVAAQPRPPGWVSPLLASGRLLASTSPAAAKISKPVAQKTQQQQALTQAANTSTKQSKSKPVAAFLSPAGAEEHTATAGTNHSRPLPKKGGENPQRSKGNKTLCSAQKQQNNLWFFFFTLFG